MLFFCLTIQKKLIGFQNYSICDLGNYIYYDLKIEFLNKKHLYFCFDLDEKKSYFSYIQESIYEIKDSNKVENLNFNNFFCKSLKMKTLNVKEICDFKYNYNFDNKARKGLNKISEFQEKQNALYDKINSNEEFNNLINGNEWDELQKESSVLEKLPEVEHYYKLKNYQTPIFIYIVGIYKLDDFRIVVLLKYNTSPQHKFRELSMIKYVFNLQPKSDKDKRVEKFYY